MFIGIFSLVSTILYGTLVHIADFYTAENWWWKYEWTASNGNKFTNVVEVKAEESLDLEELFKKIHKNGTYQGWYKVFGDEQSKVADVYTPNGNEETLYGKFGYVITFINDGQVQETLFTTTGSKGNQLATEPKAPTNPGTYTNRGWRTNENGTGTQYVKGMEFSENTTFYVKWVSVVTRNNNGAGAAQSKVEIFKGQQIGAGNLPTLTSSYTWKGWCAKNPTAVGDTVLKASWVPTGNTTIYAKWVSKVTYNYNGNGGTNGSVEILKGQTYKIPTVTAGSYTFRNWWKTSNFTGTSYTVGQSITPTGNMNIYAKWVSIVNVYVAYNNELALSEFPGDVFLFTEYKLVHSEEVNKGNSATEMDKVAKYIFYRSSSPNRYGNLYYTFDQLDNYKGKGTYDIRTIVKQEEIIKFKYNDTYAFNPSGNIDLYQGGGDQVLVDHIG